MADKKIQGDKSGNIYVEFDYNNIIIVDPNKVQDNQGNISERLVDHEDLVMYANLEAELLPRTKLAIGSSPDNIRVVSIAKINFLSPTKDEYLTTNYYDELTGEGTIQGKGQNQTQKEYIPASNGSKAYTKLTATNEGKFGSIDNGLLGITSISVKISSSFIPSVTIELEDVQGRALFQLGENSPYAAFFHLPYPPFYLTLKGYYGQAIKYQLNLEKFAARFNSMSGNYGVTLTFKGYKFNILNEIQMGHLIAVPHMYSSKFNISNSNQGQSPSQSLQNATSQQSANIPNASNSNGIVTQQMYVEKGYQKIIEVYGEYKAKNLIDKNFPELTLQQLMNKLENFEKNIIDNFKKSDVEPLTNIRNYIANLKSLYEEVYAGINSWFVENLNPNPFIEKDTGVRYYAFKNNTDDTIKGTLETKLDGIIKTYNEKLNSNPTLGIDAPLKIENPLSIKIITAITTSDRIDWVKTTTEQTGIASPTIKDVERVIEINDKLFKPATLLSFKNLINAIGGETPFIARGDSANVIEFLNPKFFLFDGQNRFIEIVNNMNADATKKLSEVEDKLTRELRDKIEDPTSGIGFRPTVRNIVAVIMASAEGFIRLLDDVHTKAWDVRNDPVRKNAILNNTSSAQGSDTKNVVNGVGSGNISEIPVYPWPQFFVETHEDKKGKYQLKYIADPAIVNLTKGYLYDKWPEVEFVEEYIKGLTQKFTPTDSPTPTSIKDFTNLLNINAIEFPQSDVDYSNKEEIKFFYEIWERQFMTSRYENLARFTNSTAEYNNLINLITEVESKNLLTSLGQSNPYLNYKLKNFNYTASNYVDWLKQISNLSTSQSYIDFIRDIFVTPYIKNYTTKSFDILSTENIGAQPSTKFDDTALDKLVQSTQTNTPNVTDLYPFTDITWSKTNLLYNTKNNSTNNQYNTTNALKVYKQRNVIANFTDINDYTTNRPVTNFSYLTVQNPLVNSQSSNSTSQTGFLPNFYGVREPKDFIPTEGYCYFDVPTNKNIAFINSLTGDLPIKTTTSIINTPFFINAISEGVKKWKQKNEYPFTEAAYLFINSLPLISLRERYKTNGTNLNQLDYMFASLKKFGALHKLPYAWILKIGSLWYRYKQEKETNTDILGNIWKAADYKESFDPITKNPTKIYKLDFNGTTGNTIQLEYDGGTNIVVQSGFYPKLINDFNYFYKGSDLYSSYSDSEIQTSINDGLKLYNFTQSNLNVSQNGIPLKYITWSVLLPTGSGYYVIPSFGGQQNQVANSLTTQTQTIPSPSTQVVLPGYSITGNTSVYNGSMRLLWASPNYGYFDDSQIVKPSTNSYLNEILGDSNSLSPYKLSNQNNYTNIEEFFSIFEKEILDTFEAEFKNFSKSVDKVDLTPTTNLNYGQQTGDINLNYKNFQLLFRSLMILDNIKSGETDETYFLNSIGNQLSNFSSIILKFLTYDVIFKYGNPSNYNRYIFDSFLQYNPNNLVGFNLSVQTAVSNGTLVNPKYFGTYVANSLPSKSNSTTLIQSQALYGNEWKELYLRVGFSTIPELKYDDNGSYITDFFIDNNIGFTVENIKDLSTLIKMYATQKLKDGTLNATKFNKTLNTYLGDCTKLQNDTLNQILTKIRAELPDYQEVPEKTVDSKVTGEQPKVNLYESFKALNDKWISGNDYKIKTFFEDILFLDRASRNIGDTLYLDIFDLKTIFNNTTYDSKMSVYTFIAGLLIKNNFTIMNLPAYVNFYNVIPGGIPFTQPGGTLEFADKMWGTFTTVDYRESGPKMVCFFVGRPSAYLDLEKSKNFLFRSDGITLERNSDNPLYETLNGKKDHDKSNVCAGFSVDIGIRNQNVFSNFTISQDNGKGTSESVQTLMNMIDQTSGREVATQNVSLYNYYSQRSYGAEVVSLGNAMIQPTMYFNLRHVPMFNGPYLITEVNHTITPGQFQTKFSGTRQGIFDLPAIDSFLQSINQNLLTKLEKSVLSKDDGTPNSGTNSVTNSTNSTQNANNTKAPENSCKANTAYGNIDVSAATQTTINESDLATKIKNATTDSNLRTAIFALCYLRTYKSNGFNSFNNNYAMVSLSDDRYKSNASSYIKNYSCVNSETANKTASLPIANFKDVDTFIGFLVSRIKDRSNQIANDIGLHQFYICLWQDITVSESNFSTNRYTLYKESYDRLLKGLLLASNYGITPTVDLNKFLSGKTYQPPVTPTPSPRPIVVPTGTEIFEITRIKNGDNDVKVIVKIKPNVGSWKIFQSEGQIYSSTVCSTMGTLSSPGVISADEQQITFQPYQEAIDSCDGDNVHGQVPMKFTVYADPVPYSNNQQIFSFQSIITV